MPCLLVLLSLITPRAVLLFVWLLTTYLQKAYQTALWPVLGFFFAPLTTLAYAYAINANGSVTGGYFALALVAALLDLGALGGSAAGGRRRGRRRRFRRR
jgi:thiol:disulfide interchange protein